MRLRTAALCACISLGLLVYLWFQVPPDDMSLRVHPSNLTKVVVLCLVLTNPVLLVGLAVPDLSGPAEFALASALVIAWWTTLWWGSKRVARYRRKSRSRGA